MSLDRTPLKRKRGDEERIEREGSGSAEKEEAPVAKLSKAAALTAYTGSGADLVNSIQTTSLDALRNSLSEFRSLTSLSKHDEILSPSDKRIQLVKEFCQGGGIGSSPPSQDSRRGLLNAWDLIDGQDQISVVPLPLFVLSNIIALLGAHQPTHDLVYDLIHKLLPAARTQDEIPTQSAATNTYWSRLMLYLSNASGKGDMSKNGKGPLLRGASEVVTLATLRLLLEVSTVAGGKYARSVFDHMNWTMKVSCPGVLVDSAQRLTDFVTMFSLCHDY
jgi:hypothetical protein